MKTTLAMIATTFLVSCAWYRGPEIPVEENSAGTEMTDFYRGPSLPTLTADNGGDVDTTSFDYAS